LGRLRFSTHTMPANAGPGAIRDYANREIGMESRRSEFFKQAYTAQSRVLDKAAGFTDRDIIPRHKVLPPISTARHNKGVFHQDNYIMCVPPRPNVQDMQTKGIMPLDTSGHTLDEAELYNPQFAHATRGRTYTYLQRRKLQEPEDRFPRAMTAAQAMTWSMKRAQAHNEANSPKSGVTPTRHAKTDKMATFYGKNKIPGFA